MSFNSTSKGEEKIIKILNQNNIQFKKEVSFKDLNGSKNTPLRFDFAIYRNNKLFCLLEMDGEQHFKFIKYFHKNVFNFYKSKEWDRRKNSYCLVRKIPLIRVPYWDLDKLTFKSLFSTPEYLVKNKYHNDYLITKRCK